MVYWNSFSFFYKEAQGYGIYSTKIKMKNHKVTYKEVIFCGIQKRGELISFHSLI
jgi:hypothetical protein